jgi:predicted permease
MLQRLWHAVRAVVSHRRLERETRDELAEHLTKATDRLMAQGLTREAAEQAVRREFGNVASIQEDARDARGGRPLGSVVADLRYGLRQAARRPMSTITIVAVLALGIGFNAALFVIVSALVTSVSPGVSADESLVRIRGGARRAGFSGIQGREVSLQEFHEYAAATHLFRAVAGWTSSDVTLDAGGGRSLDSGAATFVTSEYFPVLGVRPALGAGLPMASTDQAAEAALVAVISHAVWVRHYGRADDVVGRTIEVNGVPVTIAGVAPRRFNGARTGGSRMRVWLPLAARTTVRQPAADGRTGADPAALGVVARLQPGVDLADTQVPVQAIAERAARSSSSEDAAWSADVAVLTADNYFPPSGLGPDEGQSAGRFVVLLIPLLILAITGTTVSSLQAGLAVARRREMAVRLALGASRRRIVRQLATESVGFAFVAGAVALAVIGILLRIFESAMPDVEVAIGWSSVAFSGGLALLTGILVGLSPALHATRLALGEVLRDASAAFVPSGSRLQAGLVVAQVALTQPMLFVVGAILVGMIAGLREMPVSSDADRIMEARFNTNPRYGTMDAAREETLARLSAELAALPGVVSVVPQEEYDDSWDLDPHPDDLVPGVDPALPADARVHAAPEGYFAIMEVRLVRGRGFERGAGDADAVVIGSGLARQFWGEADPIGRRLRISGAPGRSSVLTVIGVVEEARRVTRARSGHRIFVPAVRTTGHFLIRTSGPAAPIIPAIRAKAASKAPGQPLTAVRTLAAIEADERHSVVRAIAAAGTGGSVALLLSAVGLYAVVAFAVSQRAREIGIRAALGADRRRILGMFLRRGLALGLAGLAAGLTLTLIAARLLAVTLADTAPDEMTAIALLVASVVIGVTLVASWIPARRATAVDPLQALRME